MQAGTKNRDAANTVRLQFLERRFSDSCKKKLCAVSGHEYTRLRRM